MRGVVEMSTKELERLNVLYNVRDKTITQAKAAEELEFDVAKFQFFSLFVYIQQIFEHVLCYTIC